MRGVRIWCIFWLRWRLPFFRATGHYWTVKSRNPERR